MLDEKQQELIKTLKHYCKLYESRLWKKHLNFVMFYFQNLFGTKHLLYLKSIFALKAKAAINCFNLGFSQKKLV